MKPKTQFFAEGYLNERVKGEWMLKEEGSWEDHGRPETGHVYIVLAKSPKNKWRAYTKEEAMLLESSASYHDGAWDSEETIVIKLMAACKKIWKELSERLK